jgi:hypothetical protein
MTKHMKNESQETDIYVGEIAYQMRYTSFSFQMLLGKLKSFKIKLNTSTFMKKVGGGILQCFMNIHITDKL